MLLPYLEIYHNLNFHGTLNTGNRARPVEPGKRVTLQATRCPCVTALDGVDARWSVHPARPDPRVE